MGFPLSFLKIGKKYPSFGKNCPVCVHLWVKFSFNEALRISWRKSKKIFPREALPLYVVHEVFIEVPLFQETCPALKNSWLRVCNFRLNFHPNIWIFANLLIYRKLIHDSIMAKIHDLILHI